MELGVGEGGGGAHMGRRKLCARPGMEVGSYRVGEKVSGEKKGKKIVGWVMRIFLLFSLSF
jgi:hypothetical protein